MSAYRSVLLDPAVDAMKLGDGGVAVDATFGRGGHSRAILQRLGASGRLLAFDRDPAAGADAAQLEAEDPRFAFEPGCYSALSERARQLGLHGSIDAVLFDLGVSSPQLDTAERGFSFRHDGPLDMRMDPDSGVSAADWIAGAEAEEIADVLFHYGDERASRRIARRIVEQRRRQPIRTTSELAEIIADALGGRRGRTHPATRSFQAIRIHVNQEMDRLTEGLAAAVEVLAPGGRIVVISFHSIEDRLVKRFLRNQTRLDPPRLALVGKPQFPSPDEAAENPRARSAVLRVAERTS